MNKKEDILDYAIRKEILDYAINCVCKDRNTQYGTPENNFQNIANLWSAYKNIEFSPHDVAIMMILLKIARTKKDKRYRDNYVDIAGYAACCAEINNQ